VPGKTTIEWTRGDDGRAGRTWNPVTGCTKVSAGCERCYAERFAERWRGVAGHPYEQGFDLRLWPERLAIPLRWREPKRVFVNSMSDLWRAGVPDEFIFRVFAVMAAAPRHTFMVLTKRPQRMRRVLADPWDEFPEEHAA
jgi:protein gp37